MSDSGPVTKDLVTWTLTGIGFLATFIWNFANRAHTNRIAKKIRQENFDFDEWKSERAEIMRTLRAVEASTARISVMAKGASDREKLLAEVRTEGVTLVMAHLALLRELERGRHNPCWSTLAYGRTKDGESDWDRLNSVLAAAEAEADADAMREHLSFVEPHMKAISKLIEDEVRVATAEHTPMKI